MIERAAAPMGSGVTVVCLRALNDRGAPSYDARHAATLVGLGIPTFACTPDLLPDLRARRHRQARPRPLGIAARQRHGARSERGIIAMDGWT